ncbi:MAG: DUF2250 domain-containing protein [Thermoplasmata archaeon]
MIRLTGDFELDDKLVINILLHLQRYGVDYAKSIGKDLNMNKRDVCRTLKKLLSYGLIEKRVGGMIKRKEAKLKKRVTTKPHHSYYELTEKGRSLLKQSYRERS